MDLLVVDALKVADEIEKNTRISCEIIDLRTINPIDEETIIKSLKKLKNLCVIEHGWPNSSVSSDIISRVTKKIKLNKNPLQICWPQSHVPTASEFGGINSF